MIYEIPSLAGWRSLYSCGILYRQAGKTTVHAMPQGGAGNCGGNLMSSGGSKKKMSSKLRTTTAKAISGQGANQGDVAHTVIRPTKEMRAQRIALEAELNRKRALRYDKEFAARHGGKPLGGGGSGGGSTTVLTGVDLRAARLLCLERQQTTATSAASTVMSDAATSLTAVPDASRSSAVPTRAHEDEADEVSDEVFLLMDLLGGRLQSSDAIEQVHQTLYTVLRNAAANGGVDGDAKYRTLRAQNEKLWSRLLCHEEVLAVLEAAGFEQQQCSSSFTNADATLPAQAVQLKFQQAEQGGDIVQPMPGAVESLASRLQDLSTAAAPYREEREDAAAPRILGRDFELVHPGVKGEGAMEDLAAVLTELRRVLSNSA